MSDPGKAVFLSYAREDAEAARRIAEALRGFGIEVWFDMNELRGGDQWDAKIRGQIKACALFIPIISQRTEERTEGYFRREWKLAVDRSYDMAGSRAFIVPLVVDDTSESGAAVPEEFMRAQWTRLPGGEPSPEFVMQVKRLLEAPRRPSVKVEHAKPPTLTPFLGGAASAPAADVRATPQRQRRRTRWLSGAGMAAFAIIAGVVYFERKSPALPSSSEERAAHAPAAMVPAPNANAKSIAVLPFANRSNRDEDLFFTDGVHDDLLTQISRIRAIKTISRTSVMQYRGSPKNLRTIAQELGVATILEGGVQRAGNRIRINVQLIDAATDAHLWAEIYDRELTAENIFKIQTEVATAIANALRAALLPGERQQLQQMPTHSLAALEAYFRGQSAILKYTSAGMKEAVVAFQQAIELDTGFARAYAGLANAYLNQIYFDGLPAAAQNAKAEPLVIKALQLDPQSPEGYVALGLLRRMQEALPDAETAFRRAIELNPNLPHAYLQYSLLLRWNFGRPEASLEMLAKLRELEPQNPGLDSLMAESLDPLGRFQEARELMERSVREHPEFPQGHRTLGVLYRQRFGLYDRSIQELRLAYAQDPGSPIYAGHIAQAYAALGESRQAIEWFERSLRHSPDSQESWVQRAAIHRLRQEQDQLIALCKTVTPAQAGTFFAGILLVELNDHYLRLGRPDTARDRSAALFPELVDGPNPTVLIGNHVVATSIASVLLATGEKERANLLLTKAAEVALAAGQLRGVLFAQVLQGDKRAAVGTLRQMVARGTVDVRLEEDPGLAGLKTEPEYEPLMQEIRTRLTAQRESIRQLEAGGQLAPVPPLPEGKK